MNQSEFVFEFEDMEEKPAMSAGEFLKMAEGLDDSVLEDLLLSLEAKGTLFDISDLPRLSGSGQAALRLREEMELAKQGDLIAGLEPGDALRLYLEELKRPSRESAELIAGMKQTVELAKEYTGYGVLLLDLIQEGNIGLWQAMSAGKTAPELLEQEIRQAMIRIILRQTIASGLGQKLRRAVEDYRSADERLLMELGRNPTPEEMAEHLHMTVEEVENVRKTLENARMVDKAHVTPEPEEEDPEDAQAVEDTAYYQTRERVSDLMSGLSELETEVLNLRYGLNGKPPLSLAEAARRLNLTTGQVTSIEQTALTRMRGNS